MRLYTVHVRRPVLDPGRDVQLVPEGFSWFAFLLAVPWALWHRLWLLALGFAIIETVIAVVADQVLADPLAAALPPLGLAWLIGLFANDLRRFCLERAGYLEAAVVGGRDVEEAERRFFDLHPRLALEALS